MHTPTFLIAEDVLMGAVKRPCPRPPDTDYVEPRPLRALQWAWVRLGGVTTPPSDLLPLETPHPESALGAVPSVTMTVLLP